MRGICSVLFPQRMYYGIPLNGPAALVLSAQGLAISNSETIRSVHNGFSRQEPFVTDGKDDGGENQDAFHFVAFVPFNGKVRYLFLCPPCSIQL